MDSEPIELVKPSAALREAYLDFVAEFRAAGEDEIPGRGAPLGADFEAFLASLRRRARAESCPNGLVAASTWWLVQGGRVIGTCNIRHGLNELLRDHGGHIGYSIRPSERRKGYGSRMLALALQRLAELGIDRALVTCDATNLGSAVVIRRNGGQLDSETVSPQTSRLTQRYWVPVPPKT